MTIQRLHASIPPDNSALNGRIIVQILQIVNQKEAHVRLLEPV